MPIFDIKNFGLVLKPLRSVGVWGRLRRAPSAQRLRRQGRDSHALPSLGGGSNALFPSFLDKKNLAGTWHRSGQR